jgi:ubiquinone/menaquinone biosynthesis C-methylase UbiE
MADFDRVAQVYDATRSLRPDVMTKVVEGLSEYLNGAESLLDVGIGTGRYADPLRRGGFDVVGVDVSEQMVAKAKEKGFRNLVFADAAKLPFTSRSFDTAMSVHFLHLVDDWVGVLREIGRVARRQFVSVVEHSSALGFRVVYTQLREQMGLPTNRLDGGESELAKRVTPIHAVTLVGYSDEVDANEELLHYESRLSSVTWGVPDDAHEKIMRRIRDLYEGMRMPRKQTIELVAWSPEQLQKLPLSDMWKNPST